MQIHGALPFCCGLTWTSWRTLPLARSRSTAHLAACWLFLSRSTATTVELSLASLSPPPCEDAEEEKADRYMLPAPRRQKDRPSRRRRGRDKKKERILLPLLLSLFFPLLRFLIKPTKNCRRFHCFFFFIFLGAKFGCCSVVNGRWLNYVFVALVSPLVIDCRCCSLIYFCMSLCAS